MSGALQAVFQNQRSFGPAPGQQAYTTYGTYTWVAPTGVTSVSVVAVGAGNYYSGGALGYKNNYSVNAGCSYSVRVGQPAVINSLGNSYFVSTSVVKGGNSTSFSTRATYTGDGGGNGGLGNSSISSGGGAGGYAGNGGDTSNSSNACAGGAGAGGGGGGGGYVRSPDRGGGGGGVGILGQGSSGAGGTATYTAPRNGTANGGSGGSGGTDGGTASYSYYCCCGSTVYYGIPGTGGLYGGGSGGCGGVGAVRIIWPGSTRSFPSTGTGDL